jgi:hypothetical protein
LYNVVILAFTPIVVVSEIFNGIYRNHSRSAILKHLPELKNYGVITRSRVFMKLLCDNNESAAFRAFKEITGMKPIVHHGLHQSPNTCGPAATIPQGENTAPLQGTIVSNPEPPPLWNNYQLPTYRSCAQVPTFIPKDQEFSSASSSRKPSNANQTSTKRRPVLVTLGTQLGTNWTRSWLAPTPLNQRQQQTPPLHNLSSRRSPFDDHDW